MRATINHQPSAIDHYAYQPANIKKLSYSFSLQVVSFVKELPDDRVLSPMGEQILKSSTSVGANIIEATSSSSLKEAKKFYEIALKSARKSEYWLSLVGDSYPSQQREVDRIIGKGYELRGMLELVLNSLDGKVKPYD